MSWLQAAQDQPGIKWTTDRFEAQELFVRNKAAYLAGEKWMLTPLQKELGAEKVGVVPLPNGPKGESGPFLVLEFPLIIPSLLRERIH